MEKTLLTHQRNASHANSTDAADRLGLIVQPLAAAGAVGARLTSDIESGVRACCFQ